MIELCDEKCCTQCFSCYNVCPQKCISMDMTFEGFSIPKIDYTKCIGCGLCVKSCHILSPIEPYIPENYPQVYAAWARDNHIRTTSSSGGLFFVLAQYIISQNGVVYGAAYSHNLKVVHKRVESLPELPALQESKYLISEIGTIYNNVKVDLAAHRKVLFVGTPCQVAGLKAFLRKDSDYLYTCDLVCHGVPSYKSFKSYLEHIYSKSKLDEIESFHFRYVQRWGYKLASEVKGRRLSISPYNSYYLTAFNRGLMFMESCFTCKYSSVKRISNITLGDFWNIGLMSPFHYDKRKGVSLVLVNDSKGSALFNFIEQSILFENRELQEAVNGNHNLHSPSERPVERDSYVKDSFVLPKKELIKKYGLMPTFKDYLRPFKRWLLG